MDTIKVGWWQCQQSSEDCLLLTCIHDHLGQLIRRLIVTAELREVLVGGMVAPHEHNAKRVAGAEGRRQRLPSQTQVPVCRLQEDTKAETRTDRCQAYPSDQTLIGDS